MKIEKRENGWIYFDGTFESPSFPSYKSAAESMVLYQRMQTKANKLTPADRD